MTSFINWIWRRGILATFLSGLFTILPFVITLLLMTWVANWLQAILGPASPIGRGLREIGLQIVGHELVALLLGWSIVLAGIWFVGLLVTSRARSFVESTINGVMTRIPIVKGVYRTVSQLVAMLKRDDQAVKTMGVVFCSFGDPSGAGFLALLASPDIYRFGDQQYHVVYIPTSPLPMSGGILFVPTTSVRRIDMNAESLMQIYLSLGISTTQVVPPSFIVPAPAND